MSAFAALVLLGVASSCKDQNFDWEQAHGIDQQKKFTDVFIEEFGKPAPGHQWGFDVANMAMGGDMNFTTGTRAVAKGDMNVALPDGTNVPVYVFFGAPEFISQEEHDEVFAWFSNHQVTWTYPHKNWEEGSITNTRQTTNGVARAITNQKHPYPTYTESCSNGGSEGTKASLFDNRYSNPMEDYTIVENIQFSNGWLQNVANDEDCLKTSSAGSEHPTSIYKASEQMNKLCTQLLNSDGSKTWENHVNDYNGANGYGWPNPTVKPGTDPRQSGILITDADLNNWTYYNSIVSATEDKYLLVYLQGHDRDGREWSGWYLGFDLAGSKTNGALEWDGDGICNDWILKISNAGQNTYTRSRIMCEDLGGSEITASDIDYNDLVLDVDYSGTGNSSAGEANVTLTLRAAGGTMPLAVFYDNYPLFEVHEFLKNGSIWTDANRIMPESEYMIMYNTNWSGENVGVKDPKIYKLDFKPDQKEATYYTSINSTPTIKFKGGFEFQKIKIKVFRPFDGEQGSVANYINSASSDGRIPTTEAYWVTIDNIDGEAPLKICVPQKYDNNSKHVKWLQERVQIGTGYPNFRDWVTDSSKTFWTSPATDSNNSIFYWNSAHYPN